MLLVFEEILAGGTIVKVVSIWLRTVTNKDTGVGLIFSFTLTEVTTTNIGVKQHETW